MEEERPTQIRTRTHEHGVVYAQVEQFGRDQDLKLKARPHLVLQPVKGGAAHRFPLDGQEAQELLEDYPELQQVVPPPQSGAEKLQELLEEHPELAEVLRPAARTKAKAETAGKPEA